MAQPASMSGGARGEAAKRKREEIDHDAAADTRLLHAAPGGDKHARVAAERGGEGRAEEAQTGAGAAPDAAAGPGPGRGARADAGALKRFGLGGTAKTNATQGAQRLAAKEHLLEALRPPSVRTGLPGGPFASAAFASSAPFPTASSSLSSSSSSSSSSAQSMTSSSSSSTLSSSPLPLVSFVPLPQPESESQAQSPIGQFAGLEALSEVATNEKARSDASSPTGAPSLPVKKPAFTPEKMTAMLAAVLANAAKGSPTASVPNLANMLSVMDGERKAASHINFANLLANSANNKKNTNDHDNNNDGGGNGGKKSPSTQLPATLSNAAAVAAAAASSNNQAPLLSAQSPMFCFGTVASTPKFAGPALHAPDSAAREPQDDLYGATQELEEEEDPVKVEADGARDESQRLPETMTKTKKNQAVEPADDDRNYDRNLLKMVLPPPTQYEQEVYYAYAKYRRMHLVVRAANNNVQFPPDKIAIRMRGKVRVRQGEGVDNYGRATYKDGQLDSVVTWSRTDQRNYVGAANNRHGLIKLRASKVDVRDDLVILDISILPQNVALFDAHRRIANRFTVEVICTYGKIKAIVKAPDLRVFAKQHGKKRMQDLPKEFSDRYEDYRQRVDRMRRGDHSAAHMIGASFASSPTSSPMFKLPHLPSLAGRPMDGPSATASAVAAAASPDQLASIIATLTKHQQQQQQFSMMQQRQHQQQHHHQHHQHHQP